MIDVHDKLLPAFSGLPGLAGVFAYSLFVTLGLAAGLAYLLWAQRQAEHEADAKAAYQAQSLTHPQETSRNQHQVRDGSHGIPPTLLIVAAALIGGTIGTKIPILLTGPTLAELLVDKSVVGGLIGGMLGALTIKRILHIRLRMGNVIAPAAALGLAIGRFGCFFNGCCFGIPAGWGFDFGDGQLRLPTQLFEAAFQFTAFLVLHWLRPRTQTPGILFKAYVASYFLFRFLLEFIRIHPDYWLGLTVYQLICLAGIAWVALMHVRQKRAQQSTALEAAHEQ